MKPKLKPVEQSIKQSILVKNDKMNAFYAPYHYHPEIEIIYIKKSNGTRIVGNSINHYKEGEIIVMGSGLPHLHTVEKNTSVSGPTIETIAVLFPKEIFDQNLKFPELFEARALLELLPYGIELLGETREKVGDLLEKMTLNSTLLNFICLFEIIEVLSKKESCVKKISSIKFDSKREHSTKAHQVVDYISNNYLDNISIESISSNFGMSKSGFCNFFKNHTGLTYSAYVNMLRINKACELLLSTKLSISEIAFNTGYENLAYFNRIFKKLKEVTPKVYRTNIK